MRALARLLALAALNLAANACRGEANSQKAPVASPQEQAVSGKASVMPTRIQISVDGTVLSAVLNDTKAAQEFAAMLPLTLRLEDYNGTEKISDLARKLTREGAPAGFDPSAGDIAFYAPWGNLALFYRDFRYSEGLLPLGRIEAGVEALSRPGPITARIERLTD